MVLQYHAKYQVSYVGRTRNVNSIRIVCRLKAIREDLIPVLHIDDDTLYPQSEGAGYIEDVCGSVQNCTQSSRVLEAQVN
jgi:hypothetical protein